jgi:hypothetical protein
MGIYQRHNPEKLEGPGFVKNTLERHKGGREGALIEALKKKQVRNRRRHRGLCRSTRASSTCTGTGTGC